MFNGSAGGAVGTLGTLGSIAGPVAAGVGVFAAAVAGTTYVLRGKEAAASSLSDTLEGAKIIVDKLTFSYFQLSDGAKAAAAAEQDLKRQQQSAAEVMGAMIGKREDMIRTLEQQVRAMHDTSAAAESIYVRSSGAAA